MLGYIFTDDNMSDSNGHRLSLRRWKEAVSSGLLAELDYFLVFDNPVLAELNRYAFGCAYCTRLWEAECDRLVYSQQVVSTAGKVRLLREVQVPRIDNMHRVMCAVLSSKYVYHSYLWTTWANNWLTGKDRDPVSAINAFYSEQSPSHVFYDIPANYMAAIKVISLVDKLSREDPTGMSLDIARDTSLSLYYASEFARRSGFVLDIMSIAKQVGIDITSNRSKSE